jgi:hypothetical protein
MRLAGLVVGAMIALSESDGYADIVGTAVSGFQCVGINIETLRLTPDDLRTGNGFPWILDSPNAEAKRLGQVSTIIYVAAPVTVDNGFIKTMTYNGKIGWLDEKAVRPLRRMDGSTGGCTLSRRPDGRIMFHLDPGVGIKY